MIHFYRLFDKNIVLDIESGYVHVVDDTVYRLLPEAMPFIEAGEDADTIADRLYSTFNDDSDILKDASSIREAVDELLFLKNEGQLFSAPIDLSNALDISDEPRHVKALCLNVAHDCNLDCVYCFAGKGSYQEPAALMDVGTAEAAIDFLIRHSGTRRHLEVDFFGGEPLLNLETVKAAVAYARSLEDVHHKKFRFTLTTNGLLLDDAFTEFANAELDNVVLSLDGRRDINDYARRTKGGGGTYDLIMPKLQRFSKGRGARDHYIRGTFTRKNLDFCADVAAMAELGFKNISLEPVTASKEEPYAITKDDIPAIMEEYEKLAAYILDSEKKGKSIHFFHFNIDLDGGPCVKKLISGCGAGGDYLAVSPGGTLYPCHQFVGNDAFEVGTLKEGIKNTDVIKSFASVNLTGKPECRECFAKYYCGGGCMANGYKYAGGIGKVYSLGCAMQKKRVECAIAMQAARAAG